MRSVFAIKVFLFVHLLLMHVSGANAQINKVITYPDAAVAYSMAKSFTEYALYGTFINGGNQTLYLMKTNEEFNINKIFNYSVPNTIIVSGNKNILKTQSGYTILYSKDSIGIATCSMMFLNDSLEIQYQVKFSSPTGFFEGVNIIRHPDGGYLITGRTAEPAFTGYDIFLLRTDSLGNELWRRKYGQPGVNEDAGKAFHIQGEEYFVPYGRRINYQNGMFCGSNIGYLLKINVNTNTTISKSFAREWQCEGALADIIKLDDGTFLGVGSFSDGNASFSNEIQLKKGRVTKIDSDMNIIYDKEVGNEFTKIGGLNSIYQIDNNSYMLTGSNYLDYLNYGLHTAWFVKWQDDSIYWQRKIYYYNSINSINLRYDFTATSDGGYAICGYAMDDTHNQQIWVVKTDSFGCVVPGCQMYDSVENPEELLSMKLFPNPTQDFLNIYVPPGPDREDVRIYDMQGRMVQSLRMLPAATTTMLNVRNLAPGMYFLSCDGEAIKFVKE